MWILESRHGVPQLNKVALESQLTYQVASSTFMAGKTHNVGVG